MSKNTASNQFRKFNVDAYDEDNFKDDAGEEVDLSAEVNGKAQQCREMLNTHSYPDALKLCLANPPIKSADAVKQTNYETVMSVLTAFKTDEIGAAVRELGQGELDVLMKYIYKGMAEPEAPYSQNLLNWHAAVTPVAGLGAIARVMTDRHLV